LQIKTKFVSCHTAYSKPVKQEVNSTVILPPLVFPEQANTLACALQGGLYALHVAPYLATIVFYNCKVFITRLTGP